MSTSFDGVHATPVLDSAGPARRSRAPAARAAASLHARMSRGQRLNPSPADPSYLILRSLAAALRREIRMRLTDGASLSILDVGCGGRPYEPLFDAVAGSYTGVDWEARPGVDIVASADSLPFADETFDCAICTQVLEHVERPSQVVREIRRVLKPGGLALVSTHGVIEYHPNPDDYWRWTHSGLEKLFASTGAWQRITVLCNGSTPMAIAFLLARQSSIVARRAGLSKPWGVAIAAANAATLRLDALYRRHVSADGPALVANYLVSATR